MKRISVELVPRSEGAIREELQLLYEKFDCIDIINVPELLRYDVHSWEGAAIAQESYPVAMPHIRAIDIDLSRPLPMAKYLIEHSIKEVLVVKGDPPQDMNHTVYPTVTTDVIRKFHEELPGIRVYAGIDQYRGSMRQEDYRIRRKLQAGAAGFFTQPFFDMRYVEMYAEMLDGLEVYWGVSPVMSARSQSYWEMKNNVVFPKGFEPTLDWNIDFSKRVLEFVRMCDASIYLMPIKTNLIAYLSGVFGK
ncbi:MAG: methylenetetrahydrofolate reductase [Selenomonadaceae bacterium]